MMPTQTNVPRLARQGARTRQGGLALVFVMIMMSIATAIALIAARITLQSDRASRNDRDRQIATQSAELALQDARDDIMSPKLGRGCKFGTPVLVASEGCLTDDIARGVCAAIPASGDKPLYKDINWEDASSSRPYVNYGEFTGRLNSLQVGTFASPAKAPKYIVVDETFSLQLYVAEQKTVLDARSLPSMRAYRVFALGYGPSADTQVLLEGIILKPLLATQCIL